MRLNPTTLLSLLSCATLLTACASADRVTVAAPPAETLTCAPAPAVPEVETQRAVAAYVLDCARHGDPTTDSMNIRPVIPRTSDHPLQQHPTGMI